jgi:hypothetical protein
MTYYHGIGPALRAVEVQILMATLDPSDRRFELLAKAVVGYAHAARVIGLDDAEMLAELRRELDRGGEFERPMWRPWRDRLITLARERWADADRPTTTGPGLPHRPTQPTQSAQPTSRERR